MLGQWIATDSRCRFSLNDWTIELDPKHPGDGVSILREGKVAWKALSIASEPQHSMQPEEIYIRHDDLIVRYSQSEHDQFEFQLDWRVLEVEQPFVLGIEVWISIQTRLLDTAPKINMTSFGGVAWQGWTHDQLSPDTTELFDNLSGEARAALCWGSTTEQYLWLLDPRDCGQIAWQSSITDQTQSAKLFGSFLEKGVIRRARMQLLVASSSLTQSDVQHAYQSLSHSELPLTA